VVEEIALEDVQIIEEQVQCVQNDFIDDMVKVNELTIEV